MDIRNVAIIAHVDHGKTTLVDALLRQSHTEMKKEVAEMGTILDSNELERERGITIFSKNASVEYKGTKINIIDTPGHADFGGEVERVLSMADGALLLVDAKEGPMPQTRFVLKHALKMGLKIIVIVNKIDKKGARPEWVQGKTFDLFVELGADETTAFFPTIYASGRDGIAGYEPDITKMTNITPVFEEILSYIPAPDADPEKPLQMLVSNIGKDNYKGRIAIGRIKNGKLTANSEIIHINRDGIQKKAKITSLSTFKGLTKLEEKEAVAGDIVAVTGILDVTIGETIADINNPFALPVLKIEEPTVKMVFLVNDSPFGGCEGDFKTSSQIRERLYKELETDVALKVYDNPDGTWTVCGRGELHLAILIERMRREGYEFAVSKPYVITKEVDGKKLTPFEKVYIDVPEEFSGIVIQHMGIRHAKMDDMFKNEDGIVTLEFTVSTKELIGFRGILITDTKGMGIINSTFYDFLPDDGFERNRDRGSMVAFETGETRLYGLVNVQDQGQLFIGPAVKVYKGQIVGQNSRAGDMVVNVCKEKQLSNMRSKGDGSAEHFNTPKIMGLDDALEYIDDTELVEVTPKSIRLRKIILDEREERRKKSFGIK
ncbi:GTP-binding protein TypA [Candidatus Woesebacteria bacterium RIFOXYC1_FULL_31_51]|uniref:50S ribosomal subunit assembly factor BipA n=1 Tax=Candidatus Woesebacteria bacterium GW2011_GWC2_31_9 TaxID=1618586 RepID=A0A0F9YJ37_9BACT|nr:MAG: GTP-binding protein TypA, GTP-binding protein [Candidatus Woesebacteria bacterium GW2011_GWF1_31_35]KKP22683.1 MAG: GTP-binding protein TypA/BipA [Candidatus Woesebacteria bacterium GW2011_GWC1_30_29]KKP25934.1 MAG: GTP-binding protein TypA/BipA [Candidatus Woesebacteria bacterium GW2011_GWD1_31_12]KKP27160.1 MAG: GTP-binding protein TypA/BipA [Candidatus Woesebacteria bacterium GW2011_GWB1_31_29]KKP31539.1 MAG: GTP-binding protein TypA/BipA [Candidatus Woesebacteria bacterium GW2011_GW